MQNIRTEIDRIDREVIGLLGRRFQYVQAAVPFKTSAATVRVPERFQAVLEQRRQCAEEEGLAPDAIERMYRDLVDCFVEEELKTWKAGSLVTASRSVGFSALHPHMLRRSCGICLANQGYGLGLIQDYLVRRDPKRTVHNTRVAGIRLEGMRGT